MGFGPRALQLLLNVVVITGVTSLASLWYLRWRDHRKVSAELKLRLEQPPLPARSIRTRQAPKEQLKTECASLPDDLPGDDRDIRRYVARRSREWSTKSVA